MTQSDVIGPVLFFIALMLIMVLFSFWMRAMGVDTDEVDRLARGRER